MSTNVGTYIFILIVFAICMGIVSLAAFAVKADNADSDRCDRAGGKMIRSTCIDKSVIIPLEGK